MFEYSKKGSIYLVTANGVRIHECHSESVASSIVAQLDDGKLLRDILAENIANLANVAKRKEATSLPKLGTNHDELKSDLAQTKLQLSKSEAKVIQLQAEVSRYSFIKLNKMAEDEHNKFRKEISAEIYRVIVGSYDAGATTHLWDLSPKEIIQLVHYVSIFKRNNFQEHWQVNELITNKNAWDQFDALRSNNRHSNDFVAKGIYPKYFALVCEILNIGGDGGSPLVHASRY